MNTSSNNEHNEIRNTILDKIERGEIRMHSKSFYIMKVIAIVLLSFLILITSSILISFALFSLRISGRSFLLGFGWRGAELFFFTFPWPLLAVEAILLIILDRLLKYFKFVYRLPFSYVLLGSALVVVVAGLAVDHTPFHSHFMHEHDNNHLPIVGGMYDQIRRPPSDSGVFRGVIIDVSTSTHSFTLLNEKIMEDDDATITVDIIPQAGNQPSIIDILQSGDRVFVAGDRTGTSSIRAYGITALGSSTDE